MKTGPRRAHVVSALTGCGIATGSQSSAPITTPYDDGSTSSLGSPAVSGNTNLSV